jgi:small subunit ribosomal protein S3
LRADIDFARSTAHTAFGTIGVKVWIFKGEVLGPTDATDKEEDLPSFGRERDRGRGQRSKKPGARSRRKRPEEGDAAGGDSSEE